ncbi:MAG: class I SAM-dependent methyltransferase [Undibacterium sp.]|nr:class I SAM-dependent methyltransferase [Opitutaceae bacterium]
MNFRRLRHYLLARLVERRPSLYLRLKGLAHHALAADPDFLRIHARLVRAGDCVQRLPERYHLWALARAAAGQPGAWAEAGVYRGGSAELIAAAKPPATPLHLFDTFGGMPAVAAGDGAFRPGDFADTSVAAVRARLAGSAAVEFHPGFFPDTAATPALRATSFQFVHLDLDLYQSTLAGLEFFYPRLLPGGVLISHDYGDATVPGVKGAFDNFLRGRPERVTPLWLTQGLLVRLGDPAASPVG